MIKLSVFYPNGEGKTFDMDYYTNKHPPLVWRLLGDACKGAQVEGGLSGLGEDAPAPYVACGHLYFKTMAEFQDAFGDMLPYNLQSKEFFHRIKIPVIMQ
jgi:uncharacterized protein (TIGR02118 family)